MMKVGYTEISMFKGFGAARPLRLVGIIPGTAVRYLFLLCKEHINLTKPLPVGYNDITGGKLGAIVQRVWIYFLLYACFRSDWCHDI